jgi:hypothetical protein
MGGLSPKQVDEPAKALHALAFSERVAETTIVPEELRRESVDQLATKTSQKLFVEQMEVAKII